VRILTEPENALCKQYEALMATEGIEVGFAQDAVEEVARIAADVNDRMENIGARRLHTVMEKLLDDLSFEAPEIGPQTITVTASYVQDQLQEILAHEDLSRYIL
jgi:ATP-dependent HslUV protease ATP-binding subunit HslU